MSARSVHVEREAATRYGVLWRRVLVAWLWVGLGALLSSLAAAVVGYVYAIVMNASKLPMREGVVDLPLLVGGALMAPVGTLLLSFPCTVIAGLALSFGASVSALLRSNRWGVLAAVAALVVILFQMDRHGVSLGYGRSLELDAQGRWLVPIFVLLPILAPFALARSRAWGRTALMEQV